MAVGMALNQLYPTSSSISSSFTPPLGRSPKGPEDVKPALQTQVQQMDRIYQMPYPGTQQYTTPYPLASQFQSLAKPGPSTSEDYAADPLPFEYSRKYSPLHREDDAVVTPTTSSAQHYSDSYESHHIYASNPRLSHYGQPQYPESRHYHQSELNPSAPQYHRSNASQLYSPMPSMLPVPQFPPLLDNNTKKEPDAYPQPSIYGDTRGTAQEAIIKVKTPLKLKYWRNGRRNLQCFPSCKVFGDYSAIKIEDLKQHDFMWGKCRGSLVTEVTLNRNVTFDDIVLLGRVHSLENIPVAFEEAVIRECMLGRTVESDEMDAMKDQWIIGERLPEFVQQEGNVACFEFKPKVWKYTEDMTQGKCKRRNVKYYVQFEAFVQMVAGDRQYYACIGSGMSTSFEVGSSRVLARQKRKAASTGDKKTLQADLTPLSLGQSQQLMTHNSNPHMMAPMNNTMYTPYHHEGQSRSLMPTFPHPQMMMNQMSPSQQMTYTMSPQELSLQSQEQTQSSLQPSVGEKRKMSSERPAFPADRSPKIPKSVSMHI